MKIAFSFDDGRAEDFVDQDILAKFDIPATFYITVGHVENQEKLNYWYPGYSFDGVRSAYARFEHEIGCHGWQHLSLAESHGMPVIVQETITAKHWLENNFKQPVVNYAFPYGLTNFQALAFLDQLGDRGFDTWRMYQTKYPQFNFPKMKYPLLISSYVALSGAILLKRFPENVHFAGHGGDLKRVHDADPDYFADWVQRMRDAGYEFVTVSKLGDSQ